MNSWKEQDQPDCYHVLIQMYRIRERGEKTIFQMKMDVYNVINYLLYEQAELKEKHDKLLNLVREILEAVKDAEVKRLETKKK